jgi:hypothetical protein
MPARRKPRRTPQQGETFIENALPETRSAGRTGDRNAMIADAAWFRAEKRGFAPGHELEDWLAAEREVDARLKRDSAAAQGH